MKKIILHAGFHKTATTSLQALFTAERAALKAQSVLYPETARLPFPNSHKHQNLYKALHGSEAEFNAEKATLLDEFEKSGCDTMLLSSEHLSIPQFDNLVRMKSLAGQYEIQVILYLRRPDFYVESFWNQTCKAGSQTLNIAQYINTKRVARWSQYTSILDFWSDFATVTAETFDTAKTFGVARAFSEHSGIKLSKEAPKSNVGTGMNCAALLCCLNQAGHPYDRQALIDAFRDDKEKFALGSRRRKAFLDSLAPDLERLDAKYGISFDMTLPEEPPGPRINPSVESVAQAMLTLQAAAPKE